MSVVGFFGYLSPYQKAFFACCFLALLVCVPFVSGTVRASSVLVFHTEPGSLTVKTGDVFNITVVVDNVPDDRRMESAEFHLDWNSSIVKAVDAVKVLFHEASPSNVWNNTLEFSRNVDYTAGSVSYVYSLTEASLAVSGNQTLAIITLKAVGQGSTTLSFSNVNACSGDSELFDSSATSCNVIVAEGAEGNPVVGSINDKQPHYVMSVFAGSNVNSDALVLPSWTAWNNTPFSVDVQIVDVTDMAGYDFGLSWNTRVLNCTNVAIYKPDCWHDTVDINFGINNPRFEELGGSYRLATAGGVGSDAFNGTVTVATLTFLPAGQGVTPLTFFCADLCNSWCNHITFSLTKGSVTVNQGQPPPLTPSPQESHVPNNSTQSPAKVGNSTKPSAESGGQANPLDSKNSGVPIVNEQVVGVPRPDFVLGLLPFLAAFGFVSANMVWLLMPKKRSMKKRALLIQDVTPD